MSDWLTFIPRSTVPTAEFTTSSRLRPAPEETRPPQSDPNNEYPNIPTGQSVISPIALKTFGSSCKITRKNNSTPAYFEDGSNSLWSCNIPEQGPMQWDIDDWPQALAHAGTDLAMLGSVPDTLTCEEWEGGKWGGYLMSSEVGEWSVERRNTVFKTVNGETVRYAPSFGYREGMQGPSFYRQPLAFQTSSATKRTDNATGSMSYSFGILYNKTVVLRETTMIQTHNTRGKSESRFGDGLGFQASEKVWMCVWEKTLLEVTLMVKEPSMAQIHRNAAITHGVGQDEDTSADDDDNDATATTTITVGLKPSSAPPPPPPSKGPPPHPNPPPPPPPPYSPPPPSKSGAHQPYPAKWIKAIKGPRHLSRKVYMKESRPSPDRLRRVLGIDRTDPDPNGRAKPGPVWCRKMIVQEDGGLVEFNAEDEEIVETTLAEKIDDYIPDADFVKGHDDIREFPPDTGCICTWES